METPKEIKQEELDTYIKELILLGESFCYATADTGVCACLSVRDKGLWVRVGDQLVLDRRRSSPCDTIDSNCTIIATDSAGMPAGTSLGNTFKFIKK